MKILSLFDGMSCGRVALERAGIAVDQYFSSEIDKYAIKVSQKNYPDIIQLGDVRVVREMAEANVFGKVDLLIAGSPCQGFSFAGKQLAFEDPRSVLFFEFIKILNTLRKTNPNIKFLLENVRMKKEHLDVITNFLGVEPVLINSALVSAQNRNRYYWCNWGLAQPQDRGIMLKDIVHENMDCPPLGAGHCEWLVKNWEFQSKKKYSILNPEKAITMTARQYASWNGNFMIETLSEYIVPFNKTLQILDKEVERGKLGYFGTDSQSRRVYYIHDKAVTLCSEAGGGGAKMGQYLFGVVGKPRGKNNGGLCNDGTKSPTITSNSWETNNSLLFGCITPDRINKRQNGQRFSEGNKFYTLTAQDQHGIFIEGYIRKLTPIECERLQTLPDQYTEGVSNSQRYKMLGNGWTVDVVAHILRGLQNEK